MDARWTSIVKKYSYYNVDVDGMDVKTAFQHLKKYDSHAYLISNHDMEVGDDHFFRNYKKYLPTFSHTKDHLTIFMPDFPGLLLEKYGVAYAKMINDVLYRHRVKHITIDLRKNQGGLEYPMILGLQSLLPDDTKLVYFLDRCGKTHHAYHISKNALCGPGKLMSMHAPHFKITNAEVVIKVGKKTASAAEITALCFVKQQNVKFVGRSVGNLSSVKYGNIKDYHYGITHLVCADRDKVVTSLISA